MFKIASEHTKAYSHFCLNKIHNKSIIKIFCLLEKTVNINYITLHYTNGKILLNKVVQWKKLNLSVNDSLKSNTRADKIIASLFLAVSAKCQSEITLVTLLEGKSYQQ